MSDAYEEQKASSGGLATWVFIFSALYLFISNGGVRSLISLKALAFLIVGMVSAALLIGIPTYLLQRAIGKILVKTTYDPFSPKLADRIKCIGIVLMLMQIAVTFFVTKLAYEWLF